ncbi:MAG: peptidoglycan editing factor PgeF [Thermodesulfobacteriota bacterium]
MIERNIGSLKILFFRNLYTYKEIKHFVSTRLGGTSRHPFYSMNLGLHVGDDRNNVINNRRLLVSNLNIAFENLTFADQTHSGNVAIISEKQRGSGHSCYSNSVSNSDAMVTDVKNICITILVADCVPMLFFDPQRKIIGVAHAGWRGTLRSIAANTVNTMVRTFSSLPEDIVVSIGPSIGPCCYKVGPEVISRVDDILHKREGLVAHKSDDGTGYFDLWKANVDQLLSAGIEKKNIELARICTQENTDLFFSYRHEHGDTGRFGAGIILVPS